MSIQGLKGKCIIPNDDDLNPLVLPAVSFILAPGPVDTPEFPNELHSTRHIINNIISSNFTLACQKFNCSKDLAFQGQVLQENGKLQAQRIFVPQVRSRQRLRQFSIKRCGITSSYCDFYCEPNAKRRLVNHVLRVIKNPEFSYKQPCNLQKHNRLQANLVHLIFHLLSTHLLCVCCTTNNINKTGLIDEQFLHSNPH